MGSIRNSVLATVEVLAMVLQKSMVLNMLLRIVFVVGFTATVFMVTGRAKKSTQSGFIGISFRLMVPTISLTVISSVSWARA